MVGVMAPHARVRAACATSGDVLVFWLFAQVLDSFVEMKVFNLLVSFNSVRAVPRHDGSWDRRLASQPRRLVIHLALRGSV